MSIITLTADWKNNDFYTGAVKGFLYSNCPDVKIVDISLQISPFNMVQGTFVLQKAFKFFPKGTIHIFDVNSVMTNEMGYMAIKYYDHYFIGANNGSLGLIIEDEIKSAYRIDKFQNDLCFTFPGLHVFAPAAAFLANGNKIEDLGKLLKDIERQTPFHPVINEDSILGSVVFIDSYNNLITNVSKELFNRVGKGKSFDILVQSNHYKIKQINKTYNETSNGELLALFNSAGLLEIAINNGNIAELLNVGINANIRIKFYS